jgi:hypothetical protein
MASIKIFSKQKKLSDKSDQARHLKKRRRNNSKSFKEVSKAKFPKGKYQKEGRKSLNLPFSS